MLQLKIHKSIYPLKKQWQMLEECTLPDNGNYTHTHTHTRRMSPYQTYEMNRIIFVRLPIYQIKSHFKPCFCELVEDGRTVLIAPLSDYGNGIYSYFAKLTGFQTYDFVYAPDTSISKLKEWVSYLFRKLNAKQIELNNLPEDSLTFQAITELFPSAQVQALESVCVFFEGNYDQYYASLTKHVRQNIRTAYNRMVTDGRKYDLEIIRREKLSGSLISNLLDFFYQRKLTRYDINVSRVKKFLIKYIDFQTIYQRNWKDNICIILRIDGTIAAFALGIMDMDGKIALIPRLAINDEYVKYSPGIVMLNEAAKVFIDKMGICGIDLQHGAETYKLAMGGTVYRTNRISIGDL